MAINNQIDLTTLDPKQLNLTEEEKRDIVLSLKTAIWNYAEKNGVNINNKRELDKRCKEIKKITTLGPNFISFFLSDIMYSAEGDQRILKFLDLTGVSFAGKCVIGIDFEGTNADIDPQTVDGKDIRGANFKGLDMSNKSFDGCKVEGAILDYTGAIINPQLVYDKSLYKTHCQGLDFTLADFTDVRVSYTNFKNAKMNIDKINFDPQKVRGKDLRGTNLTNVFMGQCSFKDCNICECNLRDTKAVLDYRDFPLPTIKGANLTGTTLLVPYGFDKDSLQVNGVTLGDIEYNTLEKLSQYIRDSFTSSNCSVDSPFASLSSKDFKFTDGQFKDLIITLKIAARDYYIRNGLDKLEYSDLLDYCSKMKKIHLGAGLTTYLLDGIINSNLGDKDILKYLDLDGADFAGINIKGTDFRGTNANIDPQTVKGKSLWFTNLSGLDMSDKCFDGCDVLGAHLSYTGASIDPQKVQEKSLRHTSCEGLDFSNADFSGVDVSGANFENALINCNLDSIVNLDPQTVKGKKLDHTNLTNVNMKPFSFAGCNLSHSNLTNTGAHILCNDITLDTIWGANLTGTTLFVDDVYDVRPIQLLEAYGVILGDVQQTPYGEVKRKIKEMI